MHLHSGTTLLHRSGRSMGAAALLAVALAACGGEKATGPSPVTVKTATLVVGITGMPAGAGNPVQVTGPQGFSRSIGSTATLTSLEVGTYTVTASPAVTALGTWKPTPGTVQRTLAGDARDSVGITYALSTGSLAVNISGLPSGVAAAVVVTGPGGYTRSVSSTETIRGLVPGTYTVNASSVVNGETTYTPSPPSRAVTVSASTVASAAAVSYSNSSGGDDDLSVEFAYVTQAVQRPAGDVSLVASRSALLRVFVTNNRINVLRPTVRARIYAGTTLLQTTTINAPELSVRTQTAEGTLTSTWNTVIPAENVRPGMRILVDVDPEQAVGELSESNNIWPRDGVPKSLSVVSVPPFNVRFVPVITGATTGNVSELNKEEYLKSLRRMFPIEAVNADVRLPFTSSKTQVTSTTADWGTVLSEISALRSSDGAPSTMHYYGVLKVSYTSGFAGYGYVGGRSAIGWDHLPSGDPTAAHEWGHNFNRNHSPCGGVTDADPNYPYPDGSIGAFGWNAATGTLVQPTAKDIMGYCSNAWISDWTWSQVMSRRQSSGNVVSATTGSVSGATFAKGDGLLVWGQVSNGQVTLEPAFRVDAAPTVPSANGSHRVQALDRRGQLVVELPIEAQVVDHAPAGTDIRQFAVVLPWSPRLEKSLATLRVVASGAPVGGASRTSAAAARVTADDITPELANPDDIVEAAGANRVRVRWNQSQFPMAMARDAATGQVIAFIRTPGAAFTAQNGRPIDLVYSDGVRSVVKRHQR